MKSLSEVAQLQLTQLKEKVSSEGMNWWLQLL